eukprot:6819330-Pyramimonas_sp.AAC.1
MMGARKRAARAGLQAVLQRQPAQQQQRQHQDRPHCREPANITPQKACMMPRNEQLYLDTMPDTIKRCLPAWFPVLDLARQFVREPSNDPRRDAERAQERLLTRVRARASHWLPDILLRDRRIDNRDDWIQWCTTYLCELLDQRCTTYLYLYATDTQRRRMAVDMCEQSWDNSGVGRLLLEWRLPRVTNIEEDAHSQTA